ncbi:YidH family protein [Streptomyces sp. NPDC127190]|uniref:YidH family protein n=1 Tax=unclassified Streptomyces TaxID=2593676 RepID=UPI00362CAA38
MDRDIPRDATPNTGSRARDHLANERTYLAWLRTGIAVAGLGVAIAKFAPQRGAHAVASAAILVFSGLLVALYGTTRYRSVGRQLDCGVFAPTRSRAVMAIAAVTGLAMLAALVLL